MAIESDQNVIGSDLKITKLQAPAREPFFSRGLSISFYECCKRLFETEIQYKACLWVGDLSTSHALLTYNFCLFLLLRLGRISHNVK